jgi:hypothetical protein
MEIVRARQGDEDVLALELTPDVRVELVTRQHVPIVPCSHALALELGEMDFELLSEIVILVRVGDK